MSHLHHDELPTDDGQPIRGLIRAEMRVLHHLEAAAVAFRELPDVGTAELAKGDELLNDARTLILARPAMAAYRARFSTCERPAP